jgi:hypothetical protein
MPLKDLALAQIMRIVSRPPAFFPRASRLT